MCINTRNLHVVVSKLKRLDELGGVLSLHVPYFSVEALHWRQKIHTYTCIFRVYQFSTYFAPR